MRIYRTLTGIFIICLLFSCTKEDESTEQSFQIQPSDKRCEGFTMNGQKVDYQMNVLPTCAKTGVDLTETGQEDFIEKCSHSGGQVIECFCGLKVCSIQVD